MSGVYIPNYKIPSACLDCHLRAAMMCSGSIPHNTRLPGCPLVPVPDHGRLGDLDELKRTFCEECLLYPDKCLKEECDRQGPYHIEHMAKVVIPADKERSKC